MCTLILLDRVVPDCPVLVAANRDEYYERPSAPPEVVSADGSSRCAFVAPRDLREGGTWMGVGAGGLFVGLTNRSGSERDPSRRSRGRLVWDALGVRNASILAREMKEDMVGAYNPFHLVYADGRQSYLTVLGKGAIDTSVLSPGIHVVCNGADEPAGACKADRIRDQVRAIALDGPFDGLIADLVRILADHGDPSAPLGSACVHTPAYGTRSSAIVAVGGARRGYWHAEGPPCRTPYRDFTHLLDALQ